MIRALRHAGRTAGISCGNGQRATGQWSGWRNKMETIKVWILHVLVYGHFLGLEITNIIICNICELCIFGAKTFLEKQSIILKSEDFRRAFHLGHCHSFYCNCFLWRQVCKERGDCRHLRWNLLRLLNIQVMLLLLFDPITQCTARKCPLQWALCIIVMHCCTYSLQQIHPLFGFGDQALPFPSIFWPTAAQNQTRLTPNPKITLK